MPSNEKKSIRKTVMIGVVAAAVVIAFVMFIRDNYRRVSNLSANYVKDATVQSAQRIEDLLNSAQAGINTIAVLYGANMKSVRVDVQGLQYFTEKYPFDYIDFVDENGIDINAEGESFDVSDRYYFQDGMKGNSGMDVIFDSSITSETLVVFYAPLRYKGKIIGVLAGHYREGQMEEILDSIFFGENARTYLCLKDGRVIASCTVGEKQNNIFDGFEENDDITDEVKAQLYAAFEHGEAYGFDYSGIEGPGKAYVMELEQSDWMILQTFPSKVTSQMISDANMAGIILLGKLVTIFLICIAVILYQNWIQKRKLILENNEKTHVIDGITQLFGAFILIDFEKDTYHYLAGTEPTGCRIPFEGDYNTFRQFAVSMLVYEDDKKELGKLLSKEQIQKNMDKDTPQLRYEYLFNRGNERWNNLNLICLKRAEGIPTEILFTYQDVTSIKERELKSYVALKDAYQAVESANQAKSNFLSNMSHDIRTPMNAIMGMTSIASMNIDNPERVKDCLNKITISSRHLLGLINEVLDMSKIESGTVSLTEEEFNLSEMIDNILTMFLPQLRAKDQHLKVNLSNITHEEVIGDTMRLQQVFVNILGNAIKFTPEGGNITLSMSEETSAIYGCGCYQFVFEDNGIGMEEEFLGRIFEPFARADNSRIGKIEGTGLGMSIVKNIVQMMNGDIKVQSKLGKGSRFIVTVYLQLNQNDHTSMEELTSLSVLVVDDDQPACENACGILREIGMVSDWVLSGNEAIHKLMEAYNAGKGYAAVILDWKMPGKNGIETAEEIREKIGKDMPIIILSAFDYSEIEHEAREAGVNAFISKPLFRSRLVYVMKQLAAGINGEYEEVMQLQEKDYAGKRVLLVEDNELNMEIAEELLSSTKISIDKSYNGREAVERLLEMPDGYYDLIFMDIQMPEMNGYEAAAKIRASGREYLKTIPIVAMSADAFTDDVKHAKDVGMNDHIAKPVEIDKLLKALETWMSRD